MQLYDNDDDHYSSGYCCYYTYTTATATTSTATMPLYCHNSKTLSLWRYDKALDGAIILSLVHAQAKKDTGPGPKAI